MATVKCFSEDTRRPDVVEFVRALAAEVSSNTKCGEVYTPFRRCQFGCVKFNSASDMWQFIQNVNAAKKINANTEVRARPRQSSEERDRDALMNKFLRALYRSENAPPKGEIDADYRLGKVWRGKHLIAEKLRQGEEPTIHETELAAAIPALSVQEFKGSFTKAFVDE